MTDTDPPLWNEDRFLDTVVGRIVVGCLTIVFTAITIRITAVDPFFVVVVVVSIISFIFFAYGVGYVIDNLVQRYYE